MVELQNQPTDSENPMSIDDIVDSVLSIRYGYVKGLGYGPKPKSFKASKTRTYELEKKLKKTQDELQTC